MVEFEVTRWMQPGKLFYSPETRNLPTLEELEQLWRFSLWRLVTSNRTPPPHLPAIMIMIHNQQHNKSNYQFLNLKNQNYQWQSMLVYSFQSKSSNKPKTSYWKWVSFNSWIFHNPKNGDLIVTGVKKLYSVEYMYINH